MTRRNSYRLPNSDTSLILKFDTTHLQYVGDGLPLVKRTNNRLFPSFRQWTPDKLHLTGKGNATILAQRSTDHDSTKSTPRTAQSFDLEMSTRKTTMHFGNQVSLMS